MADLHLQGFVTCGPNVAVVKTGMGLEKPRIFTGGWTFVWPGLQQCQRLDLRVMTLTVRTNNVYTVQGVPVTVISTAQIKISNNPELLTVAAGQFLGVAREDVARSAVETLEGHQRAILGTFTVEEVFQDREKFAHGVLEHAQTDLSRMGLHIISFTIRDVFDDNGYLNSLGKKRTAEVKRDARIGEAEADRDAGTRESDAQREMQSKQNEAKTQIADSERKFDLQKAAFDQEVNSEKAKANLAGSLQQAKTQQDIKRETLEVDLVKRKKEIEIESQEIMRKEKELTANVKLPAAAERYQMEQNAQAQGNATIAMADGRAVATVARGQAEAIVIKATGESEAVAMTAKADAWKQYSSGAFLELYINQLPALANKVSSALSGAEEVMFISTGGDDIGASRLTSEVVNVLGQVAPMVESFTGIDVPGNLAKMAGLSFAANDDAQPSSSSH